LAFLFANGGSVLNATGTRAIFNDSAGVDALNFYTSFQNTDHSSALPSDLISPSSWGGDDFDAFEQQRVAMVVEGGWLMQYLNTFNATDPHTSVNYGVAPLPLAPDGSRADLTFTNAWGAYSHTSYPDAAWELIQYMTGSAVQTRALHNGFALPTLKKLSNDPYLQQPAVKSLFSALANGELDCYGPDDTYIHDRLNDAIASVLSGKVSASDALNNAAQLIDIALAQNGP
jgi:multiple sugar transport system substrate-binding protein